MVIRSFDDLKIAYLILHWSRQSGTDKTPKTIELKRNIRSFQKLPRSGHKIIKDHGIDGYVELVQLPGFLDGADKEDAKEWFESHCTHEIHSAYDCTGKPFTQWFKIIQRRGGWVALHSVGFDV